MEDVDDRRAAMKRFCDLAVDVDLLLLVESFTSVVVMEDTDRVDSSTTSELKLCKNFAIMPSNLCNCRAQLVSCYLRSNFNLNFN